MQRIFNVNKWATITEGRGIEFPSTKPRVVRLEVNSPGENFLYISQELEAEKPPVSLAADGRELNGKEREPTGNRFLDGQDQQADASTVFLARVEGRDTVEFYTTGKFTLLVEGGDCNVYTIDGDTWSYVDLEPRIFTRIATRRRRNPEMELMAHAMQHNMRRMLEQQANEIRRDFERREKARVSQPAPSGVPGDARQELKPKVDPPADDASGDDDGAAPPGKPGKGKGGSKPS